MKFQKLFRTKKALTMTVMMIMILSLVFLIIALPLGKQMMDKTKESAYRTACKASIIASSRPFSAG